MVRVFVTGGGGRLGRYVVNLLLQNGYEVSVLSRDKNIRGCKTVRGTLFDFDVSDIEGCRYAIHLAGTTDMSLSSSEIYRVNVEGTKSVVEHCAQAGIPHFTFISSISVYGKKNNSNITEKTALAPDTPYAKSKFQAELVVRGYAGDVCILRPSILYGRGFDTGFKMAYERIKNGKMVIFGNGQNHLPLVHAADVANAILLAVNGNATGVYNVNDEQEMTQRELIDFVSELTGAKKRYTHIPLFLARPLLSVYNVVQKLRGKSIIPSEFVDMLAIDRVVKTDKIRAELGFRNAFPLREGLREFVEYLSKS